MHSLQPPRRLSPIQMLALMDLNPCIFIGGKSLTWCESAGAKAWKPLGTWRHKQSSRSRQSSLGLWQEGWSHRMHRNYKKIISRVWAISKTVPAWLFKFSRFWPVCWTHKRYQTLPPVDTCTHDMQVPPTLFRPPLYCIVNRMLSRLFKFSCIKS